MKDAINITAKFYEAQRVMRNFWGEKYESEIEPFKTCLLKFQSKGVEPLKACMQLLAGMQEKGLDGISQALLLAATVEVIEPAPTPSTK